MLRKGIALSFRLAIPSRNVDRLRPRLHGRPGHRCSSGSAESCWMRAHLSRENFRRTLGPPQLQRLLDQLRKGDVLVVWKLDRLSRSLGDVLTIMEQLGEAGAGFRSLTEAIDTTTPAGRMMMQMPGAFAEFERAMLRERTKAGLDAARLEGRIGGRRPKLSPQQQAEIRKMVSEGDKTAAAAARLFQIHPATVSRLLARDRRAGVVRLEEMEGGRL